jgi:hypothetical protein
MKDITVEDFAAQLWVDNLNNWDSVVVIDGASENRHGRVGTGKSRILKHLMYETDPHISLPYNLVVQDDVSHYQKLLDLPQPYLVIGVDEGSSFWYLRKHGKKDQIERVLMFHRNRKQFKFHFTALPSIWDMDKWIRKERVQWRIKVIDRGYAEVYRRNSPAKWSETKDEWGVREIAWEGITEGPSDRITTYDRCIKEFEAERNDDLSWKKTIHRADEVIDIFCPNCKTIILARWDGFNDKVSVKCSHCDFKNSFYYTPDMIYWSDEGQLYNQIRGHKVRGHGVPHHVGSLNVGLETAGGRT